MESTECNSSGQYLNPLCTFCDGLCSRQPFAIINTLPVYDPTNKLCFGTTIQNQTIRTGDSNLVAGSCIG
jgi:hypothetical protein